MENTESWSELRLWRWEDENQQVLETELENCVSGAEHKEAERRPPLHLEKSCCCNTAWSN